MLASWLSSWFPQDELKNVSEIAAICNNDEFCSTIALSFPRKVFRSNLYRACDFTVATKKG